jgi:hypothetical protein
MKRKIHDGGLGWMINLRALEDIKMFEKAAAIAEAEAGRDLTNGGFFKILLADYLLKRKSGTNL